jgi:hypothetical protein
MGRAFFVGLVLAAGAESKIVTTARQKAFDPVVEQHAKVMIFQRASGIVEIVQQLSEPVRE